MPNDTETAFSGRLAHGQLVFQLGPVLLWIWKPIPSIVPGIPLQRLAILKMSF